MTNRPYPTRLHGWGVRTQKKKNIETDLVSQQKGNLHGKENLTFKVYLDWLFMFVLPVALFNDP